MTEYVAVPKYLLEGALRRRSSARVLLKTEQIPVFGRVCPKCGEMHCSSYSEGSPCSDVRCDGELVKIGERVDPQK